MATVYSSRHSKPLGAGRHAFGGAGLNMNVDALSGETDLVTTFDDFNGRILTRALTTAATNGVEDFGWVVTEIGPPVASSVSVNDFTDGEGFKSTLFMDCGTAADEGGNLQLSGQSGGTFPHVWWNSSANTLDQHVLTFACRVGIFTNALPFDGKMFIGFAQDADTTIMDPTDGTIAVAGAGPQVGFHINADPGVTPNISLIAKRLGATAMADGTNFTNLISGVDSFETAAGGLVVGIDSWFDLAFRMVVTDASDATDNGAITAYFRRVPIYTTGIADVNGTIPGVRENLPSIADGNSAHSWTEHPTVLLNQAPNDADPLVPTIEVINGPVNESNFSVDWWSMGISRASLRGG